MKILKRVEPFDEPLIGECTVCHSIMTEYAVSLRQLLDSPKRLGRCAVCGRESVFFVDIHSLEGEDLKAEAEKV